MESFHQTGNDCADRPRFTFHAVVEAPTGESYVNARGLPMPAGSQPQASAGRKVDSRSPGADVFLSHEDASA